MQAPVSVSRIGLIHVGEERANVGKGDLHCASSDGVTAFGNFTAAVLGGEELKEVDLVGLGDAFEDGVFAVGLAKGHPDLLGLLSGNSGRSHDSTLALFLDKEESTTRIVASVGRQSFQEELWGWVELKWARSCESVRCWSLEASSAIALEGPWIWEISSRYR